jgi:hypothetical protein
LSHPRLTRSQEELKISRLAMAVTKKRRLALVVTKKRRKRRTMMMRMIRMIT